MNHVGKEERCASSLNVPTTKVILVGPPQGKGSEKAAVTRETTLAESKPARSKTSPSSDEDSLMRFARDAAIVLLQIDSIDCSDNS